MKQIQTFFLALLVILIISCKKGPSLVEGKLPNSSDITFSITLPGQTSGIKTYALGDVEENALQTVDILAFKVNTDLTETFVYKVQGTQIGTPDAGLQNNKIFKASLVRDEINKYRFVILANVRDLVDPISISEGEKKDDILKKIVAAQKSPDGKWNVTSSDNYTPLPMWGESEPVFINEGTTTISGLSLLRSIARIDVKLSGDALNNFVITSLWLYNTKKNGLVAPSTNNYDLPNKKVTAPSMPDVITNLGPIMYPVPNGVSVMNTIYTFEAATQPVASSDATALIIGGKYAGSTTDTYYRIDFLNNTGAVLNILRNFKYTVDIAKVGGAGYSSKEIAWASKPVNMEINVIPFDEAGIDQIVFDGQYTLGINSDTVKVSDVAGTNSQTKIITDYPDGWLASTSDSWISFASNSGGTSGTVTAFSFNVDQNTNSLSTRTAHILLKAGRLSKTIIIIQNASSMLNIAGLNFYLYKKDLPSNYNWYTYANVASSPNFTDDPGLHQLTPDIANSCASLGSGWRLPTSAELNQLIPNGSLPATVELIQQSIESVGGTRLKPIWYWTSQSNSGTNVIVIHGSNGTQFNVAKTNTDGSSYGARCVHSK